MGKSLLPVLAGAGLIAATGGLGAPAALGAAGGAGAAGAGAAGAGLGLAGDALAAQGAAGLLGSAGAAAAGYGAPVTAGLGAAGGTGAGAIAGDAASEVASSPVGLFGPDNEYVGKTIASELSPNAYTGGYDSLNGMERIGQRVSGFLDEGGLNDIGKLKNAFGGQQEQPQEAQNREVSGGAVAQQPEQPQGAIPFVYGQPQVQFTDEQKRRLFAMQSQGLL